MQQQANLSSAATSVAGGTLRLSTTIGDKAEQALASWPLASPGLSNIRALQQYVQEAAARPQAVADDIMSHLQVMREQLDAAKRPSRAAVEGMLDRFRDMVRAAAEVQEFAWSLKLLPKHMPRAEMLDAILDGPPPMTLREWIAREEIRFWRLLAMLDVRLETTERELRVLLYPDATVAALLEARQELDVELQWHLDVLRTHRAELPGFVKRYGVAQLLQVLQHRVISLHRALQRLEATQSASAAKRLQHAAQAAEATLQDAVKAKAPRWAFPAHVLEALPWSLLTAAGSVDAAAIQQAEAALQSALREGAFLSEEAMFTRPGTPPHLQALRRAFQALFGHVHANVQVEGAAVEATVDENTGEIAMLRTPSTTLLTLPGTAALEEAGIVQEPYLVDPQDVLGQGAFGMLVGARGISSGRDVAVKLVPLLQRGMSKALALESRMLQMQHLLLGSSLMVNAHGERVMVIVMRRVTGLSLGDMLVTALTASEEDSDAEEEEGDPEEEAGLGEEERDETALPAVGTLAALYSAARRLAIMHASGFIHNDVKPDNLMVQLNAEDPASSRGTWVDFGMARELPAGARQVVLPTVMGTPGFLAPEIRKGEGGAAVYSPASDVYAFGKLLRAVLRSPWRTYMRGVAARRILHAILKPVARASCRRHRQQRPDMFTIAASLRDAMLQVLEAEANAAAAAEAAGTPPKPAPPQ